MKKLLLLIISLAACQAGFAQGTLVLNNSATSLVQIQFWPEAPRPFVAADDAHIQLFWAPLGTIDFSLFQPLGPSVDVGTIAPGRFVAGTRTVSGIAPGDTISCFIRGWFGAPSWETSLWGGYSDLFTVDTGDPTTIPPSVPGNIINSTATPFTGLIIVIPEPTSTAIAMLGLGVVYLRSRVKKAG